MNETKLWHPTTYDKFSRFYDFVMKLFLPNKYRKKVASLLQEGNILDVACGTGELLRLAESLGLDCYGLDLSQGMINQALKKIKNGKITKGSFYDVPFQNNFFGNVVSSYALGSTAIDLKMALSEMVRVCKPNGQVIVLDWQKSDIPNWKEKILIEIGKFFEDAPRDFAGTFKELGYEAKTIKLSTTYSIITIIKHRQHQGESLNSVF